MPRSPRIAFLVAALGIANYSVMDAVMKGMSIAHGAYSAVLWRSIGAIVLLGPIFLLRRTPWPRRAALKLHFARGVLAGTSVVLFFWGLARVTMAQGIALTFLAPLIAMFLAAAFLGEKIRRAAIGGSLIASLGVLAIAAGQVQAHASTQVVLGSIAVFVASILYAGSLILLRQQAQVADPIEVALFTSLVLALVMLPPLARIATNPEGADLMAIAQPMAATLFKVTGFVVFMLVIGRRLIPHVLHWVVHTGSRELFRLAVLAIALGVAFGAAFVFEVSFALGAFFAGMILGETSLSRRAAEETLPLRDAFAVLFFVSVGMLFDPMIVVRQPWAVLGVLGIVIVGKSVAALVITQTFKLDRPTGFTVAASLAQIGEFSFILAALGVSLGAMSRETHDLILAAALLSISLNPFVFLFTDRMGGKPKPPAAGAIRPAAADGPITDAVAAP